MNKIFGVLLCLCIHFSFGTNYYVQPNSNSNNNGLTPQFPFDFCQKAVDLVNAGDTIFLMEGIHLAQYKDSPVMHFLNSGTDNKYIVVMPYRDHEPLIYFDSWEGIKISGASYIQLLDLRIQGARQQIVLDSAKAQNFPSESLERNDWKNCYNAALGDGEGLYNGQGIFVIGPKLRWSTQNTTTVPHHIIVKNCEVFDCSSSGIAIHQGDYITLINNQVHHNCWYTLYGTSGINFYQMVNTDSTIEVHNIVEKNEVYDNKLLINPISSDCKRYDGNGIILDDFRHFQKKNYPIGDTVFYPPYSAFTLVRDNVIYNNGGTGLSLYKSSNVYIVNNTLVKNGQYLQPDLNPAEIGIGDHDHVYLYNNLIVSDTTIDPAKKSNNKHTVFFYEVDKNTVGNNVGMANNWIYGENKSSLPLPVCTNCIDQVDPMLVKQRVDGRTSFIVGNPLVANSGVRNDWVSQSDFYSQNRSKPVSIGAIEYTEVVCSFGDFTIAQIQAKPTKYFRSSGFAEGSTIQTELKGVNPCSKFFKNTAPNSKDVFIPNIVRHGEVLLLDQQITYSIYNIEGKELYSRSNVYYINTDLLQEGVYFLKGDFGVKKLVVY